MIQWFFTAHVLFNSDENSIENARTLYFSSQSSR